MDKKSLHFSLKDKSIGWIEWDQADSSVNLISSSFIKELSSLIKTIENSSIQVLVLSSGKENNFCAGADIRELQQIQDSKQLSAVLREGHKVFSQFENLKLSKIAVIEGDCLGGGLEWTLCFDYRLAGQTTKLAFPEVQLGLIPGLGGCLRLPKRVGLRQALKLITTGKSLTAQKALSIGLINEQVPPLILKKRALELAQQIVKGASPSTPINSYKKRHPFFYWLEFLLKTLIGLLSKKQALKKTKGFYPAPLKAIQLLQDTYRPPLSPSALYLRLKSLRRGNKSGKINQEKKLKPSHINKEISVFTELLKSKQAQNLIRLWRLIDKAKKISLPSKDDKPIQKTAVIGAGVMGQSIAYLLADKGFKVRLIDNKAVALCQALRQTKKQLEKQKIRGKINSYELEGKLNNLSVSQSFWGFKTFDLVIEALPENLELKQKLISDISKKLNPECLFASNTSSLSLSDLAKSSVKPSRFFGLHFFNPAHKMPLLEVGLTKDQKDAFPQLAPFIKQLGKVPLFVKDSPGFVVNRILSAYLSESLNWLNADYKADHIDLILRDQFGMPLGPFELMDKIGLEVCLKTISHLEQKGISFNSPKWTKDLTTVLGEGEKSKQGFYIYEEGGKFLNPKTNSLNGEKEAKPLKDKLLIQQLIQKMSAEGKTLIQDKIVQKEEDIDLAMVLGAGFPAFLGGPMQYKKQLPLAKN